MKKIIFLILIFSNLNTFGQVAIIQDGDGFTNVRKAPNGFSEVLYKISENQVFFYWPSGDESDWAPVFINENKYSLGFDDTYIKGFIHKSRLLPLEKLSKHNEQDVQFKLITSSFSENDNYVKKEHDIFVKRINGRCVWGTDGNLPRKQVSGIDVIIEGTVIDIHEVLYSDLFQTNNNFNIYKRGRTVIIYNRNSDAAGSYELTWVFKEGKLIQRLVGRV